MATPDLHLYRRIAALETVLAWLITRDEHNAPFDQCIDAFLESVPGSDKSDFDSLHGMLAYWAHSKLEPEDRDSWRIP